MLGLSTDARKVAKKAPRLTKRSLPVAKVDQLIEPGPVGLLTTAHDGPGSHDSCSVPTCTDDRHSPDSSSSHRRSWDCLSRK
jgi:hypothetical protein